VCFPASTRPSTTMSSTATARRPPSTSSPARDKRLLHPSLAVGPPRFASQRVCVRWTLVALDAFGCCFSRPLLASHYRTSSSVFLLASLLVSCGIKVFVRESHASMRLDAFTTAPHPKAPHFVCKAEQQGSKAARQQQHQKSAFIQRSKHDTRQANTRQ
jgi:hypothetical protein